MDNKVQHIQVPHDLGVAKEIKMNPTDYLIYGYMRKIWIKIHSKLLFH